MRRGEVEEKGRGEEKGEERGEEGVRGRARRERKGKGPGEEKREMGGEKRGVGAESACYTEDVEAKETRE